MVRSGGSLIIRQSRHPPLSGSADRYLGGKRRPPFRTDDTADGQYTVVAAAGQRFLRYRYPRSLERCRDRTRRRCWAMTMPNRCLVSPPIGPPFLQMRKVNRRLALATAALDDLANTSSVAGPNQVGRARHGPPPAGADADAADRTMALAGVHVPVSRPQSGNSTARQPLRRPPYLVKELQPTILSSGGQAFIRRGSELAGTSR